MTVIYRDRYGYFDVIIPDLVSKYQAMLKPNFFLSVPRLYNKILGGFKAGIDQATGVKAWLIQLANLY
jgi:long-subunit acyl-CoA synthetase (AMP-forming)